MSDNTTKSDENWRGKVGKMSQKDIDEFLAGGVTARLACLDDDGWPTAVPLWFLYKDGGFYLIPRARSAWARYLKQNPRVSLVIDESGTQRKVLVKGEARLLEEPNIHGQWVDFANEMSVRYLGPDGPKYLVPTLNEPRWLFFVEPIEMKSWQGVDWAGKYKTYQWGETEANNPAPE